MQRVAARALAGLAPLAGLSDKRLEELAALVAVARVARGANVLADQPLERRSLYVISGEMLLAFQGGGSLVVVGGGDEAGVPINRRKPAVVRTRAITDVEVVALDDEVLDILVTWDELAVENSTAPLPGETRRATSTDWRLLSGVFSLSNLRSGAFAQLPTAHIDALLKRFERVAVRRGEIVIREGGEGDFYYVVESGKFRVERTVGGVRVELADLKSGDAFGEEALVSESKRNATVTAAADGSLLRLAKHDFDELLGEPLLHRVGWDEAQARVAAGAVWLDVRYPSEHQYAKLPGAINVPLAEVRNSLGSLDRAREYVVYCQSGRRSSAACFLFAQHGFRISMLDGGLWALEGRRR